MTDHEDNNVLHCFRTTLRRATENLARLRKDLADSKPADIHPFMRSFGDSLQRDAALVLVMTDCVEHMTSLDGSATYDERADELLRRFNIDLCEGRYDADEFLRDAIREARRTIMLFGTDVI